MARGNSVGGFSLLELLIVVGIILIVTTIALPSLIQSRQIANESAAVSNLRTINTAQVTYASSGGLYGTVGDLVTAGLLDERFPTGTSGYQYSINLSGNALDYTASADAVSQTSGRYDFYTTPDYIIRYSTVTSRAPSGLDGEPVQ